MKKSQKGSTVIFLLLVVVLVLLDVISWPYFKQPTENNQISPSTTTMNNGVKDISNSSEDSNQIPNTLISFNTSGNSLSVVDGGVVTQTISLDQDAVNTLGAIPNNFDRFITNLDVNFDGQNDVGVFTSTGYGGVNNYYNFYIYNSLTKKLEKSSMLQEISNPTVDTIEKQVKSNYRSGPKWYTNTYQFNGTIYTKTVNSN